MLIGAHFDGHDVGQEAARGKLLGAMVMLDAARGPTKFRGMSRRTVRFVARGKAERYSRCLNGRSWAEVESKRENDDD